VVTVDWTCRTTRTVFLKKFGIGRWPDERFWRTTVTDGGNMTVTETETLQ